MAVVFIAVGITHIILDIDLIGSTAVIAGIYFGWATLRYSRMGDAARRALLGSELLLEEYALDTAVARNDGWRHPAYKENKFITMHEGFETHLGGMLGVLPIISWFFGERYYQSLNMVRQRDEMYGKAISNNPRGMVEAAVSRWPDISAIATRRIRELRNVDQIAGILRCVRPVVSGPGPRDDMYDAIDAEMIDKLFQMGTSEALDNIREIIAGSLKYKGWGVPIFIARLLCLQISKKEDLVIVQDVAEQCSSESTSPAELKRTFDMARIRRNPDSKLPEMEAMVKLAQLMPGAERPLPATRHADTAAIIAQLFQIVETACNNNQARAVNAGNDLIEFLAERDELPAEADLLLVLGSDDLAVARGAAELYKSGKTKFKYVMCSGKGNGDVPEGQRFTDEMIANGVPRGAFLLPETSSRFMNENLSLTASQLSGSGRLDVIKSVVVVQASLYNRQAKAAIPVNFVVKKDTKAVQTGYVYAPSVPRIGKAGTTTEAVHKMEDALKAFDNLKEFERKGWIDRTEVPVNIAASADEIRKNLNDVEAGGVVATIIAQARVARRENQKLIIGLDLTCVSSVNNGKPGYTKDAFQGLLQEIRSLGNSLRKLGLDNVEIISASGEYLVSSILATARDTKTDLSNVIVLADATTINSQVFSSLRTTADKKGAFLAGIDAHELVSTSVWNDTVNVRIIEMLLLTLELAAGKEPPQIPIIASYDKALRIVIFLPKAEPEDYGKLTEGYKAKKAALQSA